jgi:Uma2 family endonuclease
MVFAEKKPMPTGGSADRPVPLENGESMHSREFLRRYERSPRIKKVELIEGVVYMGSPVSTCHALPDGIIHGWLLLYSARHPEVQFLPNATVILDPENTFQPDALLRLLPAHGGGCLETDEGYLAGPPELVVEIASSSGSIDLRDKRRAYCRNGVQEYLVWRVTENRFDWFRLEGDEYQPQAPDAQGGLHSRVFPGLRLPVEPLLAFQTARVLAALDAPASAP